ncbi:hypothetical protein ABZ128_09825 [Streptomyces sp. NPDC006326]|uniref:hypothetical protein n=1 Tax=Streptomyces sp. NPDC006326 TaxID=3156752 RepID=UPI0033AB26D1
MLKSLFMEFVWGIGLYVGVTLCLVAPQWTTRTRMPRGRVFRLARRMGWGKPSDVRAAEVLQALREQVPAGADLPGPERLQRRLDDRRFSIFSILLLWLFPYLGVVAALFLVLNGHFDDGSPWMVPLVWGMFGGVLVIAEVDRRMLARSVPLEHTTLMAVRVVEACREPATRQEEARGHSRSSAVCASVDELCAALDRQVELEPRRTDAVHRARLRAEALEVVRNLHAAKVRIAEGDSAALATLFGIIGSLLAGTVTPTHLSSSARPLVSAELLTADPDWEGPPLRNASLGAKVLGFGLFIAGLVAVGKLLSLLSLPEPLTWALVVLVAGAGHRALKRRIPVPDLPTELLPAPQAPAPLPATPADRAGAGRLP